MKLYTVIGTYRGKVKMLVRASNLAEALKHFEDAEEDEVEVLEPSKIEYDPDDVKART